MSKNNLLIAAALGFIQLTVPSVYSMEEEQKHIGGAEEFDVVGYDDVVGYIEDDCASVENLLERSKDELVIDSKQFDSEFNAFLDKQTEQIKKLMSPTESEKDRAALNDKIQHLCEKFLERRKGATYIQQELAMQNAILASLEGIEGEAEEHRRQVLQARINELTWLSKTTPEEIGADLDFMAKADHQIYFDRAFAHAFFKDDHNIKLAKDDFMADAESRQLFLNYFDCQRRKELILQQRYVLKQLQYFAISLQEETQYRRKKNSRQGQRPDQ